MNNDTELFELCKEVYERFPEWVDTHQCIWDEKIQEPEAYTRKWAEKHSYPGYAPLYTSDYLLEKLPKTVPSKVVEDDQATIWINVADYKISSPIWAGYITNIGEKADYGVNSTSLLKALLKLVIALDDAGVKL